jgi:hypothetical protein
MKIDGACHCGYITIEGEADPEKTTVCLCTDVKVVRAPHSGSMFLLRARRSPSLETRRLTSRPLRKAGILARRHSARAAALPPGEGKQASYMVRVGILRQRDQFVPKRQNWFRSALPLGDRARHAPQEREAGLSPQFWNRILPLGVRRGAPVPGRPPEFRLCILPRAA